jgi:hypothetical protein
MGVQLAIAGPPPMGYLPAAPRIRFGERLIELLTSLSAAADIVDAMRDPRGQIGRGGDLKRWRFEPVPWGVRFLHSDNQGQVDEEVRAVADVAAHTANSTGDVAAGYSPWPTTVVNLK